MKKIKLCGVSLCTLLAATGANAAGYTCEELIEYTSCMPGYYLNGGGSVCPAGYTYSAGVYYDGDYNHLSEYETEEEFMDACRNDELGCWWDADNGSCSCEWRGAGCVMPYEEEELAGLWYGFEPSASPGVSACVTCPDGYTCDGGTAQPYVGACEPGYTKHALCPSGYNYEGVGCFNDYLNTDKGECDEYGHEWSDIGWCARYYDNGETESFVEALMAGPTCGKCPAGYLCAGGDAAAIECPAGSYCATAGASVATGKCNIGTYSTGGAKAATCTQCPGTGLTDKDGDPVIATTSGTGATSASACFVGDDVEFKDDKGIYHYKSDCGHGNYGVGACVEAHWTGNVYECPEDFGDLFEMEGLCCIAPTTEAECMSIYDVDNNLDWDGESCNCYSSWVVDENGQLYCDGM